MKHHLAIGCASAVLLVWAPLASAQVSPPIDDAVIQGEILNRSAGQAAAATGQQGEAADNEIDGEAGIYVLTVNEIFFVSGSAGVGYSTNPTRTANDAGEDWYGDLGASVGVSTRLAGAVDFGASLNVDARDFFDTDDASSRSVSTTVSVGAPIFGPVYGSVVAFGGYAYDDSFDNKTSFYGLSANASSAFRLSENLLLRPGVGITQQWSGVSENNSLTATASVDAAYAISPQWIVSGRVSISQRNYEDFYEDVTFVEREDTSVGVSASVIWRPARNMTLAASISYEDQDSTFFLSEFDALDTGVSFSFRHTF